MSKKIFIGKLPDSITDQKLTDVFSKVGKVISVKIIKPVSFTKNNNYGYVQMDTPENTLKAIKTLDNTTIDGSRIKVAEAHFLDQERQQYYRRDNKFRRNN